MQTAPTILRRQRKNTQVMVENNNTEGKNRLYWLTEMSSYEHVLIELSDSLDEHVEMPKPHQETKKGQKHRFPFKKNREKVKRR